MGIFNKIFELANVAVDGMLMKARKTMAYRDQKAFDQDPYYPAQEQGYRERFTMLDFDLMFKMAKDSIISSIQQTRVMQMRSFCRPQKSKYDTGYAIRLRDKNAEMKDEEQQEIEAIYEWIKFLGTVDETRKQEECDTFEDFVHKIMMDRLTYDQIAIELIPTFDGRIHHLVPVDAATIRLASTRIKALKENMKANMEMSRPVKYTGEEASSYKMVNMSDEDLEKIKYVQVYRGRILEGFTPEDMIVKFGNPTNRIQANGYSIGELEKLLNIITAHLNAETHNKLQFTHGQAQKGILHIKGDVRPVMLEAFRRHWYSQSVGPNNAWRTPIIASSDEVKWIPLQTSNRDMEFTQWMNYLIKIICAIFQIDPEEINFGDAKFRGGGSSTPMFMSANESRIKTSQDRGLRPLLRFFEAIMNERVFKRMGWSDKYIFEFVGLNAETKAEELERNTKESQTFKTVDEIRKDHDLEELGPEGGGHVIQNASYIQWLLQFGEHEQKINKENQEAMMAQQGGDEGEEMTLDDYLNEGEEKPKEEDKKKPDDKDKKSLEDEPDLKKCHTFTVKV